MNKSIEEGEIKDNSNGVFTIIQSKLNTTELKKKHEEAFWSVKQKIWSLDWYFRVIQGFNPADNVLTTDPGVIAPSPERQIGFVQLTTSSRTITINNPILSEKDKLFLINLVFDGFIWNAKSILDCFANEIRFIYLLGGYGKKEKLHIDDLPKRLTNSHRNREPTELLRNIKQKNWYKQLNKYRDTTTHKNVIPKEIEYITKERTNISFDIAKIKTKEGKIFLKKDPEDEKSEEIDLKNFTTEVYNEIKSLITASYGAIYTDIEKEDNLPLNN